MSTENEQVTPNDKKQLANQLWGCGFECFENKDEPTIEELEYAIIEFQIYARNAKKLLKEGAPSAKPSVCDYPNGAINGEWSDGLQKCLDNWINGGYRCPVIVDVLIDPNRSPRKDLIPPNVEPEFNNVWVAKEGHLQDIDNKIWRRYYVRDYSGIFHINNDDPAYTSESENNPAHKITRQTVITEPAWLHTPRAFAYAQKYGNIIGPVVNAWQGNAFRPHLLLENDRIKSDEQWRKVFRVVSAAALPESQDYFDGLQAYDASVVSFPLLHYTATSATHPKEPDELGAFLSYLKKQDESLFTRFQNFGFDLFKHSEWDDSEGLNSKFEDKSGLFDGSANRASFTFTGKGGGTKQTEQKQLDEFQRRAGMLRHLHMVYRLTMLFRTEIELRRVVWRFACHRLRMLAHIRFSITHETDQDLKGKRIADVLTSEFALALALRWHVFKPTHIIKDNRVGEELRNIIVAVKAAAGGIGTDQFENEFVNEFLKKYIGTGDPGSLKKFKTWPGGAHLVPGDIGISEPIEPLRKEFHSSPFFAVDRSNMTFFSDPLFDLPVPTTPDWISGDQLQWAEGDGDQHKFSELGISAPYTLAGFVHPAARPKKELIPKFSMAARELLIAASEQYIFKETAPVKNNARYNKEDIHPRVNLHQFRTQICEKWIREKYSVGIRCGVGTTLPTAKEAIWKLDAVRDDDISAFVAGANLTTRLLGKFDSSGSKATALGKQSHIFDKLNSKLQEVCDKALFNDVFKSVLRAIDVDFFDDFEVEIKNGAQNVNARFGFLRQSFPINSGPNKKDAQIAEGEFGAYLAYLGWSNKNYFGDYFGKWGFKSTIESSKFFDGAWPTVQENAPAPIELIAQPVLSMPGYGPTGIEKYSYFVTESLLNWPALYRLQEFFQQDDAILSVWRFWKIQFRDLMNLEFRASRRFQAGNSKSPARLFHVFQSPRAQAALMVWHYLDIESFKRVFWKPSQKVQAQVKTWTTKYTERDLANWGNGEEKSFVEFFLDSVGNVDDALKNKLKMIVADLKRPTPFYFDLENILYSGDLKNTDRGVTKVTQATWYNFGPSDGNVTLGLVAEEMVTPARAGPADVAASTTQLIVYGIAPIVGGKAMQLLLPEPVLVKVNMESVQNKSFKVYEFNGDDGTDQSTDQTLSLQEGSLKFDFDIAPWLGDLPKGCTLNLTIRIDEKESTAVYLGVTLKLSWMTGTLAIERKLGELLGVTLDGNGRLSWSHKLTKEELSAVLPFELDTNVELKITVNLKPLVQIEFSVAKRLVLHLGTPIARLLLEVSENFEAKAYAGKADNGSDVDYLQLLVPENATVNSKLLLEIAIANQDGAGSRVVSTVNKVDFSAPLMIDLGAVQRPDATFTTAPSTAIEFSGEGMRGIPAWLLAGKKCAFFGGNSYFEFLGISKEWLSGVGHAFKVKCRSSSPPTITINRGMNRYELAIPVTFSLGSLICETELKLGCNIENDLVKPNATNFSIVAGEMTLNFRPEIKDLDLDLGIAKLSFGGTQFVTAQLDLAKPELKFSNQRIKFFVPKDHGFEFDISNLTLSAGGMDLDAKIQPGQTTLSGIKTLDPTLVVEAADEKTGRGFLSVKRGRLKEANFAAKSRITFFDNAEGRLHLRFFEANRVTGGNKASLGLMAEFDVGVCKTFDIKALYLAVDVKSIHLTLAYNENEWSVDGGITGSMRFVPGKEVDGILADFSDLFSNRAMYFENLNLKELGETGITVEVAPVSFEIGRIFEVVFKGVHIDKIGKIDKEEPHKSIHLLGDIKLKTELPNMHTALTLGDLGIKQIKTDQLIPNVSISSLGVEVKLDGGFKFKGRLGQVDNQYEFGFKGEASLESSVLPRTDAAIKLTRVRDPNKKENDVASLMVYADVARKDHLGYGIFLRTVGLGLGINQGLWKFSDSEARKLPLPARIENALQNPLGLPYPGMAESWNAIYPTGNQGNFSLVGFGVISFGLLADDEDHPFVGSLVLSIDDELDVVAGVNGWMYVSPADAKDSEYLKKPGWRGALGISPREKKIYGHFMTLPDPKFGKSIERNESLKLLAKAMKTVQLPVKFYSDPYGALIEIAYRREARFDHQMGPLKANFEAGFRFGYYRDTLVLGLNLAAYAELGGSFSGDLGFANVEISATAKFNFSAEFAGALLSNSEAYLLADLSMRVVVELAAKLYKRIEGNTIFGRYSITLFDVNANTSLSLSLKARAAMVPAGFGFSGTIAVEGNIAGFGISLPVHVAYEEDRVADAKRIIDQRVPPIDRIIEQPNNLSLSLDTGVAAVSTCVVDTANGPSQTLALFAKEDGPSTWMAFWRRQDDNLRLVLFPHSETNGYPIWDETSNITRNHEITIAEDFKEKFKGIVGQVKKSYRYDQSSGTLIWQENSCGVVGLQENVNSQSNGNVFVKKILKHLTAHNIENIDGEEVVDPRTQSPVAGDFDDPLVLIDSTRRSTRFRVRKGTPNAPSYDDHLAKAQEYFSEQKHARTNVKNDPLSQAELLMQLINLAEDSSVSADIPVDDSKPGQHNLAAYIGMVLEFEDRNRKIQELLEDKTQPEHSKVSKLFEKAKLFDTPVTWRSHVNESSYRIISGYWFQGKGEVGLVWSLQRSGEDGKNIDRAPHNHAGIHYYEVYRTSARADSRHPDKLFKVNPVWATYTDQNKKYYIRPQFQFLDTTLSKDNVKDELKYEVIAYGDGGQKVASQEFFVAYSRPKELASIVQAQVLLVIEKGKCKLEFSVAFDKPVTNANSLSVKRRNVERGTLGHYGIGADLDQNLTWKQLLPGQDLAMPEPDQSRGVLGSDLESVLECVSELTWTDKDKGKYWTAEASLKDAEELKEWVGESAAEFYVRLDPIKDSLEMGTPYVKCRTAVTSSRANKKQPDENKKLSLFSEGTNVAVIERLPVEKYGQARSKEEGSPKFLCEHEQNKTSVETRVVGSLPHINGEELFGSIVGYRIWACDTYLTNAGSNKGEVIAEFMIEPELIFRSNPLAIVPEKEEGGGANWQFPNDNRIPLWRNDEQVLKTEFVKVQSLGRNVALKKSMVESLEVSLNSMKRGGAGNDSRPYPQSTSCRYLVNEAFVPASTPLSAKESPTARINTLLERFDNKHDYYGWNLLEALGCSATVWLQIDDDRLTINELLKEINNHAGKIPGVAAAGFSRLSPPTDPKGQGMLQYGMRVFASDVLCDLMKELPKLASASASETVTESPEACSVRIANDMNHPLYLALEIIAPPTCDDIGTDAYKRYVFELAARCRLFAKTGIDKDESNMPIMYQHTTVLNAKPDSSEKASTVADKHLPVMNLPVLPIVDGVVTFVKNYPEGYAKQLKYTVETIRRYDLLLDLKPAEFGTSTIDLPRTLQLEPHTVSWSTDTETSSLRALVSIHPAQRASLYDIGMKGRTQYEGEYVNLHHRIAKKSDDMWKKFFNSRSYGGKIDWNQYRTYAVDKLSLDTSWKPAYAPPFQKVKEGNGFTIYSFLTLAPEYEYWVEAYSRAGARRSKTAQEQGEIPSNNAIEPLFSDQQGLRHSPSKIDVEIYDRIIRIRFRLAVCGEAIPETIRDHWLKQDKEWNALVPVLAMPDLRATYVICATQKLAGGTVMVELAHLKWEGGPDFNATMLVAPYNPPKIEFRQMEESEVPNEDAGALALTCDIGLLPELEWLERGIHNDTVTLRVDVVRDGVVSNKSGGSG